MHKQLQLIDRVKRGCSIQFNACRAFHFVATNDPCYDDSVCYQRFCCKIEFAVIKKLNMDPSKAGMTDISDKFFY